MRALVILYVGLVVALASTTNWAQESNAIRTKAKGTFQRLVGNRLQRGGPSTGNNAGGNGRQDKSRPGKFNNPNRFHNFSRSLTWCRSM